MRDQTWVNPTDIFELDSIEKYISGLINWDEFKVSKFIYAASQAIKARDYPSLKKQPDEVCVCEGAVHSLCMNVRGLDLWFTPRFCRKCRSDKYESHQAWMDTQRMVRKQKSKGNDLPEL